MHENEYLWAYPKHTAMKTFFRNLLIPALFVLTALPADAQRLTHLWTGLRDPQPEHELPRGNTPFQVAERVPKKDIPTAFIRSGGNGWTFAGGWEMTDAATLIESGKSVFDLTLDTSGWFDATVPGTVLTTLVDQGVYPDPYFGLNNMAIPDSLCRTEWWYRNVFDMPDIPSGDRITLHFDGINYMAEVYLNGRRLGGMEGAFMRGVFDITEHVRHSGGNVLAVRIVPPKNPGIPHEQSMAAGQGLNGGALSMDGPTFISSMGWDWIPGIRDRNAGIWQDVRIKSDRWVSIGDPLVTTRLPDLPDTGKAAVTIAVPLCNHSGNTVSGQVFARIGKDRIGKDYELRPGESAEITFTPSEYGELNINNPRLWWPNGYGSPELYDLELEVETGGTVSDTKRLRFGIRELSYELMVATPDERNERVLYTPVAAENPGRPVFDYVERAYFDRSNQLPTYAEGADMSTIKPLPDDDPVGPYLVIRVNGVRIFCRGGNWGMDDGMKRSGRDRLEPYVRLHRDAGFNIIRNWTGESTQESFYELCDEYGMLVWNDFWITTDDTVEPLDVRLFMRNARDVVRRFRNHPSIAVWCPRNEGFAPRDMERLIPAMVAEEDPTRHYHGQSRYLNMDGSGPWGFYEDPARYYTHNAKGFITEIGTFAVPTAGTIRKFIGEADQWPVNDVWAYHDLHHTTQNFSGFMAAVDRYGEPDGMEDFSRKAQLVCYDAWRAIMEAWNSRMWDTATGQILWMSHPAWPSMIWQTYTYDYETPGSYFGAKKACEPLHVQMNLDNRAIVVINSTRETKKNLTVTAEAIDPLTGRTLYSRSGKFDAAANALTKCFIPELPAGAPGLLLVRTKLASGRETVSVNDYWFAADDGEYLRMNDIPKAEAVVNVRKRKGGFIVEVTNRSDSPAVSVKLNAVDKASGEIILPAYFSDGYFNLMPGEKRNITLELPADYPGGFTVTATGYNLR